MTRKILPLLTALVAMVLMVGCGTKSTITPNREESLQILDAKIKKDSKNPDLYYQRGQVLLSLGKDNNNQQYIREALADFERAIKLDDDKAEYYTAQGDAYFSMGNVGESYSALQNALKIDENNFEACLKMGEIAFYSKDYDRAMESLNKVTAQDKDNQTALFMKGFIYKENADTAKAVYYFRRVIDLYPEYEPAYEELGLMYAQYKDRLGFEYLSTALELDPDNINVLYGMAMLFQDLEEAEAANEYYVKILEIDPNYKYAWFNRGWMELVFYEDYEAAVDFFTKAIDCDPNYAAAHHNRGLAYEMMGDKVKAQACYDEAKSLGYVDE